MNSIFESNLFWGIILGILAIIIHYSLERKAYKYKLEIEKEFKEYIEKNKDVTPLDYNLKEHKMRMAIARYKLLPLYKWILVMGSLTAFYRFIFSY